MFRFLGGQHPALYMIIVVATFSTIPALFELGGAEKSPFLFSGILQIGIGLGLGTAIVLLKKKLPLEKELLLVPAIGEVVRSHYNTGLIVASVIGSCFPVLFALGLRFVDVSIAAILYETSPLFLIMLMSLLFYDKMKKKNEQRYNALSIDTMFFIFLAMAGVALVVLSQNSALEPLQEIRSNFATRGTLLGAGLVLLSAVCAAMRPACTAKIGDSLAKETPNTTGRKIEEIVFSTFMTCVCSVIAGGTFCVLGLIMSETISSHQLFYASLGGFADAVAIVAFRTAILKTKDLGVNAISFATPLVALMWLWALSLIDVPHLDYLIIGAMGIVASNLLVNAEASKRVAYKALVASLWVFGTVVYFTDGSVTDIPLELPVTIFILVLAFRVDRLVRRTSEEEKWVFEVFHRLRFLASKKQIGDKASQAMRKASKILLEIDRHKSTGKLNEEYVKLVKQLEIAVMDQDVADEITSIRHKVDNLAHSRQQGSRFGEIVAIAMTGGLIVFGLLFFTGDRGFYGEVASFLLSSVVVFLFFNIVDLQNDRRDQILTDRAEKTIGLYIVKFDDVADRKWRQWISVTTSTVIVVVFVWLFKIAQTPF